MDKEYTVCCLTHEVVYSTEGKTSKFKNYNELMLFISLLSEKDKETIMEVNICCRDCNNASLLDKKNLYKRESIAG